MCINFTIIKEKKFHFRWIVCANSSFKYCNEWLTIQNITYYIHILNSAHLNFFFSRKLCSDAIVQFNLSSREKFVNFENWKLRYYIFTYCTQLETTRSSLKFFSQKEEKRTREDRSCREAIAIEDRESRFFFSVRLTFSKVSKIARPHLLLRFGEQSGSSGDRMNF